MKLVGERRALAAVVFAFYFINYLINAIVGDSPMAPALYALAGTYGLAFLALVAGYFWARWYSIGVGLFGVILSAVAAWQVGLDEMIMFLGGTHLTAVLMLWGTAMAEGYDGQTAWRERFHMDEHAVQRLGRSVIRAGVSLPMVLVYGLMPKPGAAEMTLSLGAVVLVAFGLRALVQMRTWGVLAIGAAAGLMLSLAGIEAVGGSETSAFHAGLAGAMLVITATPWAAPTMRWLRRAV